MNKTNIPDINQEDINLKFVNLAKKYNLNPLLLKEIVELQNQGYKQVEIAKRTGVARQTVAVYLEKLREIRRTNKDDFAKLVGWALFLVLGVVIITELFRK